MHYFHDGIEFAQLNLGQVHETLSGHKRSLCEAGHNICFSIKNVDLTRLHRQTDGQTEKDDSYIPLNFFFGLWGWGVIKPRYFTEIKETTYIKK